jgi:hypothetical protein
MTTAAAPDRISRLSSRPRRFYGWRIVGTLAVTETVSWGILYYAFAVFQVPMRAELGFSAATTAGAFSVAVLVTGLAAVPVGRWLDRHGARGLMTSGSVAAVLMVVAWSRVQTVAGLYLVFAGIGLVSAAVLYEPAFAVVVRWFAAARDRALLAVTVVAGFASTVFLPSSDALVRSLGWRDALLVLAGVLAVTTILPHAWVLRRDPADLGLHPDGAVTQAGGSTGSAVIDDTDNPGAAGPGLRRTAAWALRDPLFRWLTLAFAAHTLAVVVVAVQLVPFLQEHGHSSAFAAAVTGALGALSVTGRLAVTGAARRWPTAVVASVAFGLQCVGVAVLLAAGSSRPGALVFVALFGLGFGVGTVARPALLADAYGTASYATLSALGGVAFTAAKTVGPLAAGAALAVTGSWTPVLLGLLTVTGIASAAAARSGSLVTVRAAGPARTCVRAGPSGCPRRDGRG